MLQPHGSRRRSPAFPGGLLVLIVFVVGIGLAGPSWAQQEIKKPDPKKDQPSKDDKKKTDADKEIDELVKEMTRNMPAADPATIERTREQVRNMSPQQRKNMLTLLRNRTQPGFGGQPFAGGAMGPGFGGLNNNFRLGVRVDPPSDDLAEQLDLPRGKGLVVRDVLAESAAAKAGIKRNDVILELNGKAVSNRVDELTRLVADIKPDTAVEIVVMRKGKKETIKDVKLPEARLGQPGFPGGFPGAGQPQGGFPQQQPGGFQQAGGFQPPLGMGGAASVVTTMVRTQDRFTLRHQEGSLIITLTGRTADGKPKINEINVQDGFRTERYETLDKVPDRYHDKVKNLIEMSEKGSVRIDIKSP